jgi:DNA invertase Pin-like site-specific DNA recombinase
MSQTRVDRSRKIRSGHFDRAAYVYVRQSSPQQVEQHREGGRRQYQLVEWAQEVGWPRERIVVVDEDQGKTGSRPQSRSGFGRLVAAVGRGEVGIVIALEVTRLARNSPDWHHLVYLCRWTETLIADEHAVYDPADGSDRMVLGLRGQMSELELDNAIHRMVEARWNKARRGELMTIPPAGYDIDDLHQLVMSGDEAVVHAIRSVFDRFEQLGSARQVFLWWRAQQLRFPVRRASSRSHPIVWVDPSYRIILNTLRNPIYAGAYVFGRTRTVRELDPEDPQRLRVRRSRREDWPVLIREHHAAYVSFEKYLENQERLRSNRMMPQAEQSGAKGPAREGAALLQGLVRCGHCSRGMGVSYGGHHSEKGKQGRTLQYRCTQARPLIGGKGCQTVGGRRIDESVVQAFLEAVAPAGVEAAREAEALAREHHVEVERYWKLQIEKAEYEAQRAERQFNAVEPENRVVARELERRWNARLVELDALRAKAADALAAPASLSPVELEKAQALGADLEVLWNAETTTHRDRKRLLRCVIEEVQLRTEEDHYRVRIVWKGGAVTDREVPRRAVGETGRATAEETVELVRKLAVEFDDTQIARTLNRQGRRTGLGNAFTKQRVTSLRGHHRIPACAKKTPCDPREGPFTADEAAAELGVSMTTVHRWLREGLLAGTQLTRGAPWQIVLTEDIRQRLTAGEAPPDWVGLSEAGRHLGLSKQRVAYLVKTGKLNAVRTTVGKRPCWRIDVLSATCGRQADLFDPTTNENTKEA